MHRWKCVDVVPKMTDSPLNTERKLTKRKQVYLNSLLNKDAEMEEVDLPKIRRTKDEKILDEFERSCESLKTCLVHTTLAHKSTTKM